MPGPGLLDGWLFFSFYIVLTPGKRRVFAPDPLLMWLERDLSNVFVVVENRLSQRWSSFPHSPDIQASLTQTHQSMGHRCRVTRPGSGLRQAGRAIVMQQIDQVSQDTAKLSICRTVHTVRVCGGQG